jgi:dephospho-CoA kinase
MKIIGLTGGTGSGKSSAARRFEEHNIPVIDADRIGHALISPGGAAEVPVIQAFGEGILTSGIIDRAKLGAIVFDSPDLLAKLNSLVHPRLFQTIAQQCQEYLNRGEAHVVIDAALLAERGVKEDWLSLLVLVTAPEAARVKRLATGRSIPVDVATQRIRAQSDPELKRPLADWVIDNGGSIEQLNKQVDTIVEELLGARS